MRTRTTLHSAVRLLLPAVAASLTVAIASGAPPQQAQAPQWRARLLAEARAVSFEAERPPVPDDSARIAYPATLPRATYAPARQATGNVWVAGRVTSKTAYSRLGIAPGVNYVWIVAGKPARMAIVPADSRRTPHWLPLVEHAHPSGAAFCLANRNGFRLRYARAAGTADSAQARTTPGGSNRTLLAYQLSACACVSGVWQTPRDTAFAMFASDADQLRRQ